MSSKNKHEGRSHRKLALESLERRELMAGDVAAHVSYGTLYVNGDNYGNGVNVTQVAPGTYDVGGAWVAGGATRVNGSYAPLRFYGVSDDIRINTGGGSDRVVVGGSSELTRDILPDDLVIDSGSGNDFVRIQWLSNRDYNDRMTINTGRDDDRVEMYKVVCRDAMNINTAENWDAVDLSFITVGTKLSVNTGAGNDTFRLNQALVDHLFADMGSENDTVSVRNSNLRSSASLFGGYGTDTLNRYNNNRLMSYSSFEKLTYFNS